MSGSTTGKRSSVLSPNEPTRSATSSMTQRDELLAEINDAPEAA